MSLLIGSDGLQATVIPWGWSSLVMVEWLYSPIRFFIHHTILIVKLLFSRNILKRHLSSFFLKQLIRNCNLKQLAFSEALLAGSFNPFLCRQKALVMNSSSTLLCSISRLELSEILFPRTIVHQNTIIRGMPKKPLFYVCDYKNTVKC